MFASSDYLNLINMEHLIRQIIIRTYLFVSRLFLEWRLLHELIILLAVLILVEILRPNNNDFISKRGQLFR